MPSFRDGDGGGGRSRGATQRERDPRGVGADPRAARRGRADRAGGRASSPARSSRARSRALRARGRHRATAASAARRSSRPPRRSSCCSRAASTELVEADARRDGRRRHPRPDRRRLRPLLGRRRSGSSPTSRRCSTTTRCSPAPTCTAGRRSATSAGAQVCERTLDWALREMRGPEGGFYSALDADSEGVEGRFYVWTPAEIREVLEAAGLAERGRRGDRLLRRHASAATSRAQHPQPDRAARTRRAAAAARRGAARRSTRPRAKRVWPGLDDKRLASWNALMIAALADAGAALGRDDYLDAARDCAEFVCDDDARRATAACCAPGRTARRSSTPTSRTTPTWSRRC